MSLEPSEIAGRVVAVTGASRGIGRATVELLAHRGARVLGGSRRVPTSEIADVTFLPLEVTDEESVMRFVQACEATGVDTLVHNAGVGVFKPIESTTIDDYRRVADTNVLGMLLMCKHFVRHAKRRHASGLSSWLICVTSDVSDRVFADGGLYAASKHAQRAMARTVAIEGQCCDLRVTEVRSGAVDTDFAGSSRESHAGRTDLKPSDVASAILYAMSVPRHVRLDEIVVHNQVQPVEY